MDSPTISVVMSVFNGQAFLQEAIDSILAQTFVDFEFDPHKSETNKSKHGIDFVQAQALWKSKHVLLGAKTALEKRYMVIGRIGAEYWSAIITYHGAAIRIISVRKSTPSEIDTYEKIEG